MKPVMEKAKIKKENLRLVFDRLKKSHRIIGPKIESDVIVFKEIDFDDIPSGYRDHQGKGRYRVNNSPQTPTVIFSFSTGPDSVKRFLHPPAVEVFTFRKSKKGISKNPSLKEEKPLAFLGVRACDIAALKLLDRVFLEGPVKDTGYYSLRDDSLIIGINCLQPGDNCFCNSMGTGPEIKDAFDLAITELDDCFLIEAGSSQGREILNDLPSEEFSDGDIQKKALGIEECRRRMKKSVKVKELPRLVYRNFEHPRWNDVARRCLACGNCTQVCPTCFCNSSYDYVRLPGPGKASDISGARIRTWDSCFSLNFARVHGGNFRPSRRARYRQWLAHKLAYWIEQFGAPGCVGCGRCITWCPVGIDITEELESLRK